MGKFELGPNACFFHVSFSSGNVLHHFIMQNAMNKKSLVIAVCFLVVYTPETEIWERHLKENKELYSIFFFFSGKHTEANFSFLIKLTQPLTLANVTTTHFQ